MIRILSILLFLGGVCLTAKAQIQQSRQKPISVSTVKTSDTYAKKMNAIVSCQELNEQLIKHFGANYAITNESVMAKLKANITDPGMSAAVRKSSLYAVYGEEYIQHLNLIYPSTQNKTK